MFYLQRKVKEFDGVHVTWNDTGKSNRLNLLNWRINIGIHREKKPDIPNRDQMIEVLKKADPFTINSLVIDLNGKFHIIDPRIKPFNDLYAVRHRSFDYVGKGIENEYHFIDKLYPTMLQHWLIHLQSNVIDIFAEEQVDIPLEEILSELSKV